MGLAKKGSRRIRVGGTDYRWALSTCDGCMEVVVELHPKRGQRLVVVTSYHNKIIGGRIRSTAKIGPAFVARAIAVATKMGWDASAASRTAFRLIETEGQFAPVTMPARAGE
jgi:hypothetical protein